MNARPLAEIIEEGKRLIGKDDAAFLAFYIAHGPALLAVAEDAGRFSAAAEAWLTLLDTPAKVDGAAWTRMRERREKLLAHFNAPPPEPKP